METLLCLSIALFAGLMLSRVAKIFKLPAVTAYLVAGILVGPYFFGSLGLNGFGFTSMANIDAYDIIPDVALGFIAFSIGNEFRLSQLKQIGKQATIIGIFQALATCLIVDAILIIVHFMAPDKLSLPAAITLGAVATATAPAATLMVVKQYKSEGKLTDLLLPIVAIDDAVGLVIFAVSFGIAKALGQGGSIGIVEVLVNPMIEIVASILLGAIVGALLSFAEKFFDSNSKRQSLAITSVILAVALSKLKFTVGAVHIGFSPLLVCMMLGTIFCNLNDFSEEIMAKTDKWTAPLFMLFFVISGAELELSVFKSIYIVIIGVVYIAFRSFGKYYGARWSSQLVHCEDNVKKYLGITLLPQAGVALGMATIAHAELGEPGAMVRNIVLFGVLIYELVGPTLTRIALTKAGDIKPKKQVPVAAKETD